MKWLLSLLLFCSVFKFNFAVPVLHSVEDDVTLEYYWRDYNGLVPVDAIEGGKNNIGETTYIGQFSIPIGCAKEINVSHTIPAFITKGDRFGVGGFCGVTVKSNDMSNLKILCSGHPEKYIWHSRSDPVQINCRYVIGGYEQRVPMYIGRTIHNKQVIVGKIFSNGGNKGLLSVPDEGVEHLKEVFEALLYCN